MVAEWLRSLCPQHAGLTFEIMVVQHKSSIQFYNYQCWRTRNCSTNAQTMFHWNSLDTTKHGCKSATQPMPSKCNRVFQPAGSLPAKAHLKHKQATTKTQPEHSTPHQQALTRKTHGHPHALMPATMKQPPSHRAGKHPISTPQTAVKNPMNKIGQPPERKRPTQPTRWTKSHKRTPMQSPINQNRSKRVKTPIKTPEKYPKAPKSTFLFIKSDILCMLPRQMIKIGHLAPAQCGKWPKMFTGTFSPFLSAKINTNTITFFKIAIIYVQ